MGFVFLACAWVAKRLPQDVTNDCKRSLVDVMETSLISQPHHRDDHISKQLGRIGSSHEDMAAKKQCSTQRVRQKFHQRTCEERGLPRIKRSPAPRNTNGDALNVAKCWGPTSKSTTSCLYIWGASIAFRTCNRCIHIVTQRKIRKSKWRRDVDEGRPSPMRPATVLPSRSCSRLVPSAGHS